MQTAAEQHTPRELDRLSAKIRFQSHGMNLRSARRIRTKLSTIHNEARRIESTLSLVEHVAHWSGDDDLKELVAQTTRALTDALEPNLERALQIIAEAERIFCSELVETVKDDIGRLAAAKVRLPLLRISDAVASILRGQP